MVAINLNSNGLFTPKSLSFNVKNKSQILSSVAGNNLPKPNLATQDGSSQVQSVFDQLFAKDSLANQNLTQKLKNDEQNVFENFISNFTFSKSGGLKNLNEYDSEKMVYTIAAKYAAIKEDIQLGAYSDKEKQDLTAALDKQLEDGLSTLEERFGLAASSLFKNLGSEFEAKNAASSLKDLILEQADKFSKFLESDEGKQYLANNAAKFTGKSDVNLSELGDAVITNMLVWHEAQDRVKAQEEKEQDTKAEATKLDLSPLKGQKLDKSEESESAQASNKFTLNDLKALKEVDEALGMFVKADINQSEEELGYNLGVSFVKALDSLKKGNASDKLTSLFRSGFDNLIDEEIKNRNATLRAKQEQNEEFSEENQNPQAYKDLNASTVKSAFSSVVSAYDASNDAKEAVISGFDAVNLIFKANLPNNSKTMRYQASSAFFDGFYQNNFKADNNPYSGNGRSSYAKYMNAMDM